MAHGGIHRLDCFFRLLQPGAASLPIAFDRLDFSTGTQFGLDVVIADVRFRLLRPLTSRCHTPAVVADPVAGEEKQAAADRSGQVPIHDAPPESLTTVR
ncbi:MAG: hypothetical protein ABI767_07435 [Rhodanobacter sp.]